MLAARILLGALLVAASFLSSRTAAADAPPLKLAKGDRIVIVGNTLAERMQQFGNLEALLYSRFPELDLVIRDLGWSADELTVRMRSQDFQDHGHNLTDHKPSVLVACYGFNESFGGKAGLAKFEQDLEKFITESTTTKYNGVAAPATWCWSRRSRTRICTAARCPTARRTTRTSSFTPTRWPGLPPSTASSTSTCSLPRSA